MSIFKGSGVAIVTPFNKDGSINFGSYEKLINFQIENSTDAIITCGTTGEASTMSDEEHLEVVKFTVAVVNKRVPVIAGTGSNDTRHGVALTKDAKIAGADACLLVTPYYNKANQQGLYEHYVEHAKAVDLPMILYNVPSRTGLNLSPSTVYKLSKIDNIVGIKEASGNITQIMELSNACQGVLDIYSGNDDHIVPILSVGGVGVISVLANVMPKQTHDMVMDYLDGKTKEAAKLQLDLLDLVNKLFSDVNPIPVKTALKYMGFDGCYFRLPLSNMEPEKEEVLKQTLLKYGLIK